MTTLDDLVKTMEHAKQVFQKQLNFLTLDDRETVLVGDLHGDSKALEEIFKRWYTKGYRLLFVGDYVDHPPKGGSSIEVLQYLFSKVDGENVILLRGNHEFEEIYAGWNPPNLSVELSAKGMWNDEVETALRDTFSQMPYIATLDNMVVVHGGLPDMQYMDQIKDLPKGVTKFDDHEAITQIVWSDLQDVMGPFEQRNTRYFRMYTEELLDKQLNYLNKKVLIRGHDSRMKGFSFPDTTNNCKVLTLLTSMQYNLRGREDGVLVAVYHGPTHEVNYANNLEIHCLRGTTLSQSDSGDTKRFPLPNL